MQFCPIMTTDLTKPIECSKNCKWYDSNHTNCKIDQVITEVESVNLEYINEIVSVLAENHEELL